MTMTSDESPIDPTEMPRIPIASDTPDFGKVNSVADFREWCKQRLDTVRNLRSRLGEPPPASVAQAEIWGVGEIVRQCQQHLTYLRCDPEEIKKLFMKWLAGQLPWRRRYTQEELIQINAMRRGKKASGSEMLEDVENGLIWAMEWATEQAEGHGQPPGSKGPMTVPEANEAGMKLAKTMRAAFFAMSIRQQAKEIGCAFGTWKKTAFFRLAQEKRPAGKPKKSSSPKTESLTAAREAVTGEGEKDEVLEQLIADQEADKESSPLENRPRKIRSRKRL